ncbi:hypothetical protein NP493_749g00008 [Ridgeia piscesae]|uniref:Uncharacterized protein n=1 Tax=Ridgeia piscesae TaxID=27915 RepID=A0AAD9KPJ2_RIDPI|nr:hypothetical protein NP493_749g00008 [Ridgeia piscesae]
MHCLKGVREAQTWSGAVQHCHDLHAQVLTLDVLAFDDSVTDVDVVLRGINHGILMEIAWEEFWIGMTVDSRDDYHWINGKPVTTVRAATNSREQSDVSRCVFVDPYRDLGHEWVGTDCDEKFSYVCQKPSAPSDVRILQNPSDLTITTMPQGKGSNQPAMRCDAANYDRRKSVVWVHDGKYIDNGPPPGGLTLYLSSLTRRSRSTALSILLEGYYHCEVWGQDPVKKVASSKAYLRFKDVLTVRGSLRLPGGHYNPDYVTHDPMPDSPQTNFTVMLTELGTVRSGRFTYLPVTRIQKFSQGSLIISFDWTYSTTGNRGPRRLSDKQYERLVARLFSKVTDDIYVRLTGSSFYSKYVTLLSGIQRSDITLRRVDGRPLGTCACVGSYKTGVFWGPVDLTTDCKEPDGSSLTHGLRRLAQTQTNATNVGRVSDSATRLTEVADQITYPDIAYTSRIMQNMAGIRGVNRSVGRDMVKIANNILKARRSEIVQAQRVDKSSNRIVRALETYGRMVDLGDQKSHRIVESDVTLEVWDMSVGEPIVGFGSLTSSNAGFVNQSLVSFVQSADLWPNMTQAAIMLSRSTVDLAIEISSRTLRRPRGQKVLFNLALALLAVYIVFLAGIKATSNRSVCIAVAALLQYFLLASFAWMLVEASLLYMRFVKVFNTYIEKFILKVAIPAWGIPALIVGTVAAVDYNLFRGPDDYCWLDRPAFYYGFALPVGIVIVLNAVIFIFIIKGITCDRGSGLQSTQSRAELNWLQLQAAIASFVILGLTWVVGFFAVRDARITLQYIFCILNSTQGLLIFLFHNIREKSVRAAWRSLCCRDESSKMTFTNPVTSIASAGKRASSKRRSRNHSLVHPNDVTRTYSNPDERKNTL